MNDIGAINRVLRLVSLLSDYPQLTAKQAAELLGWPVSSTHRLLHKLAESEFALQTQRGSFAPGMELHRIVGRLNGKMPFAEVAGPLLSELTRQFNETSMLSVLERRQQRMYIALAASPPDPMRYIIDLNRHAPLVWGASGRSLLAWLDPEEIDAIIAADTRPNVRGEALDPDALRRNLAEIVRDGFALSRSHRTLNSIGIASPFFGPQGDVLGCVAFQVPAFRFEEKQLEPMVAALKQTAMIVSQQMGARADA